MIQMISAQFTVVHGIWFPAWLSAEYQRFGRSGAATLTKDFNFWVWTTCALLNCLASIALRYYGITGTSS
ncbi:hypothetical protein P692DRAFT_20388212 [Suillus brevipes Sb2]|nr:hypothetical protein P692DRAFT_20388212 [Suillus brevipes Sb2]